MSVERSLKRPLEEGSAASSDTKLQKLRATPKEFRLKVLNWKRKSLKRLGKKHKQHLSELFFLQNNGNLAEFASWLDKIPTEKLRVFIQANSFDCSNLSDESGEGTSHQILSSHPTTSTASATTPTPAVGVLKLKTVMSEATGSSCVAVATSAETTAVTDAKPEVLPEKKSVLFEVGDSLDSSDVMVVADINSEPQQPVTAHLESPKPEPDLVEVEVEFPPKPTSPITPAPQTTKFATPTPVTTPMVSKKSTMSAPPSKEEIAERAKHEASVLNRIANLRKEGLWSMKKLPKCADPARAKCHWDYLLEEMQWLYVDFEQEHKWKKAAARKVISLVAKKKHEQKDESQLSEAEKEKNLKRIAHFIAKEVRQFWANVEKVVEYKSQTLMEEQKKKMLDIQLNFIVGGQTEKFSRWLQDGLNKPQTSRSVSKASSMDEDKDFEGADSSDDETAIAVADKDSKKEDVASEIAALQEEADLDIADLLKNLPADYIRELRGADTPSSEPEGSVVSDESEEEPMEEDQPAASETAEAVVEEVPRNEDSNSMSVDVEPSTSLKTFDDIIDFTKLQSENSDEREQELAHIAESAEKFMPNGYTLETTNVVTPVPVLLKHKLREYQHVGLDWLVTLYDKKLNGILADEMGLGKTIQTIALLAHLAHEKGIWGPHLIVVPTTLMLNWEMEFKKWCPAFKILTYYGNPRDRKEKRKGWTKPNVFHVCITSYKLVVQDHNAFRRKKWRYLILDEAQNIKNFKSQRWQSLLNFNTQRRLLLTGTPLQNSLIELWSLMHFLMPQIFASHRDFKDWFANPLSGVTEGSHEYKESIIVRLHKILRPFLLRRMKAEVEKQLPKKFEHVISCKLSKRQRFLYDDFMLRATTKDELESGSVMGVMNILMQLRKVCNHPNLFEPRPIVSSFTMTPMGTQTASIVQNLSLWDRLNTLRLATLIDREGEGRKEFLTHMDLSRKISAVKIREEIESAGTENSTGSSLLPADPGLRGFQSKPLKAFQPAGENDKFSEVSEQQPKRKLEFVIPSTVAKSLNFGQPVMIQVQTTSGVHLVPIMLQPQVSDDQMKWETPDEMPSVLPVLKLMPSANPNKPPTAQPAGMVPVTAPHAPIELSKVDPKNPAGPFLQNQNFGSQPSRLGFTNFGSTVSGAAGKPGVSQSGSIIPAKTILHKVANINVISDVTESPKPKTTVINVTGLNAQNGEPQASKLPLSQPQHSVVATKRSKPMADSDEDEETSATKMRKVGSKRSNIATMLMESRKRFHEQPINGSDLRQMLKLTSDSGEAPIRLEKTSLDVEHFKRQMLKRFALHVPKVRSVFPSLHVSHPESSAQRRKELERHILEQSLSHLFAPFHTIATAQTFQFPEARLIEYDCGKLQTLAVLLRDLKMGDHRCLIFTQMTKMLDILEVFLSYHGYKYLRLDGATGIEQRQFLMEKFNNDRRIFVFILSTRSGGLGVNLTGADTVIFYDSDWNPSMDAQAQDRCHRIGQTRDVHIYRLICERSVEENILKKAKQKRLLGETAIEQNGFIAEFFKQSVNLRELIELPTENAEFVKHKMLADTLLSQQELEQALSKVEDEGDVAATSAAKAEENLGLTEFDESKPIDEDGSGKLFDSKAEKELKNLIEQLTPVERYALSFLEFHQEPISQDELRQTEEDIEAQKKEWESHHLNGMKGEEEIEDEDDAEDDLLLTYPDVDSAKQMFCDTETSDEMPLWTPPLPPMSETDFDPYVDCCSGYMYEWDPMRESQLPPIHIDQSINRFVNNPKKDNSVARSAVVDCAALADQGELPSTVVPANPQKVEHVGIKGSLGNSYGPSQPQLTPPVTMGSPPAPRAPRSLFEVVGSGHRFLNSTRYRRDERNRLTVGRNTSSGGPDGSHNSEILDVPEWSIQEEWQLHQTIQKLQQLSLTNLGVNPAQTPNWELISSIVSANSFIYRSPRQCQLRFEFVVLPREEGRLSNFDPIAKKINFSQLTNIYKKNRFRTAQLFHDDAGLAVANTVGQHFSSIRSVASRRIPSLRQKSGTAVPSATLENKQEMWQNINYPVVMWPLEVAQKREQTIREREKQKASEVQLLQQNQNRALQQNAYIQQQVQQSNQMPQPSGNFVPQNRLPNPNLRQQIGSPFQQLQQIQQQQQSISVSQGRSVLPGGIAVSKATGPGGQGNIVTVTPQSASSIGVSPLAHNPQQRLLNSGSQASNFNPYSVRVGNQVVYRQSCPPGFTTSRQKTPPQSLNPSPGPYSAYRQVAPAGGVIQPQAGNFPLSSETKMQTGFKGQAVEVDMSQFKRVSSSMVQQSPQQQQQQQQRMQLHPNQGMRPQRHPNPNQQNLQNFVVSTFGPSMTTLVSLPPGLPKQGQNVSLTTTPVSLEFATSANAGRPMMPIVRGQQPAYQQGGVLIASQNPSGAQSGGMRPRMPSATPLPRIATLTQPGSVATTQMANVHVMPQGNVPGRPPSPSISAMRNMPRRPMSPSLAEMGAVLPPKEE